LIWTLQQVPEFYSGLCDIARQHRFLLTAYGSTLKHGEGKDLDLIATPYLEGSRPAEFLMAVRGHLGRKFVYLENSSLEVRVNFCLPDGRLVDLRVVL
jgi:hypothetical protein